LGGASDNGPYTDRLNWDLTGALLSLKSGSLPDACEALEEATVKFHERHIWPQGVNAPTLETLIMLQEVFPETDPPDGLRHVGSANLVHIHRTSVVPLINEDEKSIGIGSYLADYLAGKLKGGGLSESLLVAIAVYILREVKLHVDGVGLSGKIVLFDSDGSTMEYVQSDIEPLESLIEEFDDLTTFAFHHVTESGDNSVAAKLTAIAEELMTLRGRYEVALGGVPNEQWQKILEEGERTKRLGGL
jgi:hypothetical protein